jgi:hypothetical protein
MGKLHGFSYSLAACPPCLYGEAMQVKALCDAVSMKNDLNEALIWPSTTQIGMIVSPQ